MHLYYTLSVNYGLNCAGEVGGFEIGFLESMEPMVRYHPVHSVILTCFHDLEEGHW